MLSSQGRQLEVPSGGIFQAIADYYYTSTHRSNTGEGSVIPLVSCPGNLQQPGVGLGKPGVSAPVVAPVADGWPGSKLQAMKGIE